MIREKSAGKIIFVCCVSVLVFICIARAAPVSLNEALAIADLWYCMELNSGHLKISDAERTERLSMLPARQVRYLVAEDELADSPPNDTPTLAYVVLYYPSGFVIVAGDDRIEPVISFSAESRFRWDYPEHNFLRYFLCKDMQRRWNELGETVHPNWSYLRSRSHENLESVCFDTDERALNVYLKTAIWHQWPYYNDTVIARNGNTPGIPTGCTATAMAIKMRFHCWPPTGSGSHSYTDNQGAIQYSHSVNFSTRYYNWSVMPETALTTSNPEVAKIMYDCGMSVYTNYEVGSSGAELGWVDDAFDTYFRYEGTSFVYDLYNPQTHVLPLKKSILGRLPVVFGAGHHVGLVDGFREPASQYFHINCGWGGNNNNWYSVDSMPWGPPIVGSCPYGQPENWCYVDANWSGSENGQILTPYNTLSEGEGAVPDNGTLLIKQGTYVGSSNVPITFSGAETIRAYAGTAIIGENVSLTYNGVIKLYNNGDLKIH
jgi:hypothetical protein